MGDILPAARKAASESIGECIFVSLGKSEERIWDFFGIAKTDVPAAILVQNGATSLRRFPIEGKLESAKTYLKALEDLRAGKLKEVRLSARWRGRNRWGHVAIVVAAQVYVTEASSRDSRTPPPQRTQLIKSEEEPADNDSRDVKVLTGNTFADTVLANDNAVLVEFYAPWCGHCKRLAPTLERIGRAFKGVDTVVVGKMDSTQNDSPGVGIEGFPTLKLFPTGLRDAGDALNVDARQFDEIVAFILENAGHEIELSEETIAAAKAMEVTHVDGFDGPIQDEDIAAADAEVAENEAEEEAAKAEEGSEGEARDEL